MGVRGESSALRTLDAQAGGSLPGWCSTAQKPEVLLFLAELWQVLCRLVNIPHQAPCGAGCVASTCPSAPLSHLPLRHWMVGLLVAGAR